MQCPSEHHISSHTKSGPASKDRLLRMLYLPYEKAYSVQQVMPGAHADMEHPTNERIFREINFFFKCLCL